MEALSAASKLSADSRATRCQDGLAIPAPVVDTAAIAETDPDSACGDVERSLLSDMAARTTPRPASASPARSVSSEDSAEIVARLLRREAKARAAFILVEAEQVASLDGEHAVHALQMRLMETLPAVFDLSCEEEGVTESWLQQELEAALLKPVAAAAQAALDSVTSQAMSAAFLIAEGSKSRTEAMEHVGLSDDDVAS